MCTDDSFLLSNARLFEHPVVYCSSGFTQLTGWSRHDLLRRSAACSMMHGPLTDPDAVTRLRQALQSDAATEPFQIVLYSTNGEFFFVIGELLNYSMNERMNLDTRRNVRVLKARSLQSDRTKLKRTE